LITWHSAFLAVSPEALEVTLQMFIVLGAAKVLAEVCEHLHMPGLVGSILAGVVIGPWAFNWVHPNHFLSALAELGVMFLLFSVGLEVKASELLRVGRTALRVALLGVALPFLLGWWLLAATGHAQLESIFVGAAMVATSVGITAQVLAAKGVLAHRTAKIILAAAVIDDVLGLLILAVVSSMAEGGVDIPGLITTAMVAGAFIGLTAKFGTPAVNLVLPKLKTRLSSEDAEFGFAMVFLFAMSLVAVYSGVAAIIGAFLAGMTLAESAAPRVHALTYGATELLVPFFLADIGMRMDIRFFGRPSAVVLGLAVVLVAVASKWIGCGLGAFSLGWKDASRIGLGMIPRGEVGMVVAQIGLAKGIVEQDVYAMAVFMAVMTTVIAPPMLSRSYRGVETEAPVA
jgi:Kef-type K+ transport system membrane component KefB